MQLQQNWQWRVNIQTSKVKGTSGRFVVRLGFLQGQPRQHAAVARPRTFALALCTSKLRKSRDVHHHPKPRVLRCWTPLWHHIYIYTVYTHAFTGCLLLDASLLHTSDALPKKIQSIMDIPTKNTVNPMEKRTKTWSYTMENPPMEKTIPGQPENPWKTIQETGLAPITLRGLRGLGASHRDLGPRGPSRGGRASSALHGWVLDGCLVWFFK